MSDSEVNLGKEQLIEWQRSKREEWLRDKAAIEKGDLRPSDLSWAQKLGLGNSEIDFSGVDATLQRDEDDKCWADD
jgi:hypothetical protein